MRGPNIFFMQKYGKIGLNYLCHLVLSVALIVNSLVIYCNCEVDYTV